MFIVNWICQSLKMLKLIQIWNSCENNLGVLFIDSDLAVLGLFLTVQALELGEYDKYLPALQTFVNKIHQINFDAENTQRAPFVKQMVIPTRFYLIVLCAKHCFKI